MPKTRPAESPEPAFLKGFIPYLVIIVLGSLIYGQSLNFGFTYCDDYRDIIEKHEFNDGFSKVPEAFTSSFGILYRPVLRTSWIVDEAIGGTSPGVYHATNVLYHLIASCLVMIALLRLGLPRLNAFLCAMVFTAHPLLVQAVVWIPGRNDSLLAIFVLLSLISLARVERTMGVGAFALHFLLFALALFTKETAALFPLLGMYYIWVVKRQRLFSKWSVVLVAGWLVAGVGWLLARHAALAGQAHTDITGLEAFVINLPAFPSLFGKSILPWNLSALAIYDTVSTVIGLACIAALVGLGFAAKKIDFRLLGLGVLWLVAFMLPAMFHRLEHAADHYDYLEHRAYVPLFGVLLILQVLLAGLGLSMKRRSLYALFAVLLVALSAHGFVHSRCFSDMHVFWETAIEKNPSRSNFHSVQGKLLFDQGKYRQAMECFEKAIELSKRNDPGNYKNLSVIYNKLDAPEKALAMLKKAVELDPANADYHYSLGRTYYGLGRLEDAESHFMKAVALNPSMPDAYIHLVGIRAGRGEIDEAIEACNKILAIDANHFHALNILGSLYSSEKKMDLAARMWQRIIRIKPDHIPAYESLMRYHLDAGRNAEAKIHALEVLRRGGEVSAEVKRKLEIN